MQRHPNLFSFSDLFKYQSHYSELELSQEDVMQSFNPNSVFLCLNKPENFKILGCLYTTDVFP